MAIDDGCKLFVAGLPDSITEDVLRQLFEASGGEVVEVSIPRDRATGRPRGFAFVTLSSDAQAQAARDTLDNSMQSGRSISVRPFQSAPPKRGEVRDRRDGPGGERRPDRPVERFDRGDRGTAGDRPADRGGPPRGGSDDRTLYLGNLPYGATPAEVEALLTGAGVGPVVRVTLPQDADGRPRGFGFVTLGSVEAAQSAVDSLANADMGGRRISASIARGRSERGPRPVRPPGGGGYSPRPDDGPAPFRGGGEPRMDGPPPADAGSPRADGRRRKDNKKKAKKGGDWDQAKTGGDRARGRKDDRWDDDADEY